MRWRMMVMFIWCFVFCWVAVSTAEAKGRKRHKAAVQVELEDGSEKLQDQVIFSLPPEEFEEEKVKEVSGSFWTKSGENTIAQVAGLDSSNLPVKFSLSMSNSISLTEKDKKALADYDSFFLFTSDQVTTSSTFSENDDGNFQNLLSPNDLMLFHGSQMTFDFTIRPAYRTTGAIDLAQICFVAGWVGQLEYDVTVVTESGKTFVSQGLFDIPEPATIWLAALGGLALLRRRR